MEPLCNIKTLLANINLIKTMINYTIRRDPGPGIHDRYFPNNGGREFPGIFFTIPGNTGKIVSQINVLKIVISRLF